MIELKDGTHISELCFKRISANGIAKIGYGISEEYQNNGYATEAVKAILEWTFTHPNVVVVEAETDFDNVTSKRVLKKCSGVNIGDTVREYDHIVVSQCGVFMLETKAFGMTDGKAIKCGIYIDSEDHWIFRKNQTNKELKNCSRQLNKFQHQYSIFLKFCGKVWFLCMKLLFLAMKMHLSSRISNCRIRLSGLMLSQKHLVQSMTI